MTDYAIRGLGLRPDIVNKPTRLLLSRSGYDPDGLRFPGLYGPVYNVKAYQGVGVTDSSAIQAAITDAGNAGGGIVYAPSGIYTLGTGLINTKSNVHIMGDGPSFGQFAAPFAGAPSGGTIFRASAALTAGIMFTSTSVSGAGNRAIRGGGVQGISLDCNGFAAVGLALSSVNFSVFRHVFIANALIAGLLTNCVATLNDTRTSTRNLFEVMTVWNDLTDGDGVILDGDSDAGDTGGNTFNGLQILHKGGVGLHFKNCDSNILDAVYTNGIGVGKGVVFEGSNVSTEQVARANIIRWLSAPSGVTAKGTASYTFGSRDNIIERLDFQSASIFPTIEVGAGLTWAGNAANDVDRQQTQLRGDVSITIIPGVDKAVQIFNTPLTAPRTVTISTTGINGKALGGGGKSGRVTRSAAATGASTLTVAGKALAVGTWADWNYDGATGVVTLTAAGSL